jgi:hypothetical protein
MNYPYPQKEFCAKLLQHWLTITFGNYQWLDGSHVSFITERGDYLFRIALWGWYVSVFLGKEFTQSEIDRAREETKDWLDLFE